VDEVLTINEVAALLKLTEKTVYSMANAGELPAFKIRIQWRIRRLELDQWMDAQPRGSGDDTTNASISCKQPKSVRRGAFL
jgi:excisionase family DNA binding protein